MSTEVLTASPPVDSGLAADPPDWFDEILKEAFEKTQEPSPLRLADILDEVAGSLRSLQLRWADVDLKRGLLTVQAAYAKNGKTRSVPLN